MTQPPAVPPETIGTPPKNATEVNGLTGSHLREFLRLKTIINQDANFMSVTDLKAAPYWYTEAQESDLKSAIVGLDTDLDGIDLTFINRVVGM